VDLADGEGEICSSHRGIDHLTLAQELTIVRDHLPLAAAALPVAEVDARRFDPVRGRLQHLHDPAAWAPAAMDLGAYHLSGDAMLDL
jgi:hypothetical protein